MTPTTAQLIADALGQSPYTERRNRPTDNAQENLMGRTHYVDPGTLRFHKSRVLSARPAMGGAFFLIVESCALDYNNTQRGFRAVLFDLIGNTMYHPKLEECRRSRDAAMRDYEKWLATFDPIQHYAAALNDRAAEYARAIEDFRTTAAELLAA
jgi:hypothetical protein